MSFAASFRGKQQVRVVYAFHTWRALLLHIEAKIKGSIPRTFPVKIYIPVLQTPQGIPVFSSPYLFAIAYDTSGVAQSASGSETTGSVALTIASGTSLWSHVWSANPQQAASTVKWNTSENLTSAVSRAQTSFTTNDIWYIAAPTAGSFNLTVTYTSACEFDVSGVSLTGTHASPLGATASNGSASASAIDSATTTTVDNSWIVDGATINGNQTTTATGSGHTLRQDFVHNISSVLKSALGTMTTTTAGSYSPGYSWTPARVCNIVSAEVKEAAAAATTTVRSFMSLGVGK